MRSNSLGMKLKKTEDELKQQEQEIADQHQLHQLTLKELELIKSAHQITQQECQQLRARVYWGVGGGAKYHSDMGCGWGGYGGGAVRGLWWRGQWGLAEGTMGLWWRGQ